MVRHHPDRLWAEVVRISYYLHWSLDSVLDLEHRDRRRVLGHVEALRTEAPIRTATGVAGFAGQPGW